MAYGTDPTKMAPRSAERSQSPTPRELDRFDECMSKSLVLQDILSNLYSDT